MKNNNLYGTIYLFIIFLIASCSSSENRSQEIQNLWSVKMANSVINKSDSLYKYNTDKLRWQYDLAFLGLAINKLNQYNDKYSNYMKIYMDQLIEPDGSIKGYELEAYNIDNINPAKNLFGLYTQTRDEKYKTAIMQCVEQMRTHPKTELGGFWHKKKYPHQMWLDGIYMASPFLAQYASEFDEPQWYDIVTHQIILIYKKTVDESTGLLYHAWDESHSQEWCDAETGKSKHFWSRAIGWYVMAIVDVLEFLPENHKDREHLISILRNTMASLLTVRDAETGLWYQVLDKGDTDGNYLEASGSSMFVYAMAKGAKKGYLKAEYLEIANLSFNNLVSEFIKTDDNGRLTLTNVCGSCGLGGGNPYRDGSYHYYITEKRIDNDPKGVAPFILAACELNK